MNAGMHMLVVIQKSYSPKCQIVKYQILRLFCFSILNSVASTVLVVKGNIEYPNYFRYQKCLS